LIIDDEEAARYVLTQAVCPDIPVQVREATDGVTGLQSARDAQPQLIFLDIRMPGKKTVAKCSPSSSRIPHCDDYR
jgi:CheY-like chemotaxis protein